MKPTNFTSSPIFRALLLAAFLLLLAWALRQSSPELIGGDTARRILGVVMGCVVIGYANVAPKALTPLARLRCNAATEQAVRRFSAWALVLGGLAYAITWLFAPMHVAPTLAVALMATSLVAVLVRLAVARLQRMPS